MTDFPDVKLKALVSFPATVLDGTGIDVTKQNGTYRFDLDFGDFAPPVTGLIDAAHQNALLWNNVSKIYTLANIAVLGGGGGGIPDAPVDGTIYGRRNAAWASVSPSVDPETVLRYIPAWKHGVPGDSSDQTTALQAIINTLPAEGGEIALQGVVNFTTLDVSNRRNIRFTGVQGSGQGPGAAQRAVFYSTAGAIGAGNPAINCRTTMNVSFKNLQIGNNAAAFNGTLIDYGGPAPIAGNDSAYMCIDDCIISTASASAVLLSIYGATDGRYNGINFSGPGIHVKMQNANGVGFVNGHVFFNCTFHPGVQYPVLGSCEAVSFIGCVFQAGTDGKAWAIQTSLNQPFKGISVIGCWFGDVLSAGGEWIVAYWGTGLSVTGNNFTGVAGSYALDIGGGGGGSDLQLKGVRGVHICGNNFDGFNAAINCSGTIAAKTNMRGAVIGGNFVVNSALIASSINVEQVIMLPNSVYGATASGYGSHLTLLGLPSYADRAAAVAGGLTTGQVYQAASGANFVLQVV